MRIGYQERLERERERERTHRGGRCCGIKLLKVNKLIYPTEHLLIALVIQCG